MSIFENAFAALRKAFPRKPEKQRPEGGMIMESCGSGDWVRHPGYSCASVKLRWVSHTGGSNAAPAEARIPTEHTEIFPVGKSFTAAGKRYKNLRQLFARTDEKCTWCRDKYGREVLYLRERFPCFDSFDAMDESRFYRWFFLREGGRLTRIYYMDGGFEVHVTEDVENLEWSCWEKMQELDYFSQN